MAARRIGRRGGDRQRADERLEPAQVARRRDLAERRTLGLEQLHKGVAQVHGAPQRNRQPLDGDGPGGAAQPVLECGEVCGDAAVQQGGLEVGQRDDAVPREGGRRGQIHRGEIEQPAQQPGKGGLRGADRGCGTIDQQQPQLGMEPFLKGGDLAKAIAACQLRQPLNLVVAGLFQVRRQPAPGHRLRRQAPDVGAIGELPQRRCQRGAGHACGGAAAPAEEGGQGTAIRLLSVAVRPGVNEAGSIGRRAGPRLTRLHEPALRSVTAEEAPEEHRTRLTAHGVIVAVYVTGNPSPHDYRPCCRP